MTQIQVVEDVGSLKKPEVVDVITRGGVLIGGVIVYGRAKLPFVAVISSDEPILTGKRAKTELAKGNWEAVPKPHRLVKEVATRTFADVDEMTIHRVTVFLVTGNRYIVLRQGPRNDGKYIERFSQLDPLLGWWLDKGLKDPEINEISDECLPSELDIMLLLIKQARSEHKTSSFWSKYSLEKVVSYAMTGW